MKKVAYSKKRFNSQVRMTNALSKNLVAGKTLTIVRVDESTYTNDNNQEVNSDNLIVQDSDGNKQKLSVKEFVRMTVSDNGEHYLGTEDDGIELPTSITVVSMKPRLNRDGDEMFSTYAYKDAQKLIDKEIDYNTMLAGGLLEVHGFEALQDYVIAVEH